MPRKLKTYQTSIGFFDLAIAAPSMKAALAAWGSKANLFHQGFAKEADDPAIVAATMARPGVVLKRAVGSKASFCEDAALPRDLTGGPGKRAPKGSPARPPPEVVDDAVREVATADARDQERRVSERRRQEAARDAERQRRDEAIAKAQAVFEEAKRTHDINSEDIAAERSALDRRSEAEGSRWDKERAKLETALRRARE